MPLLLQSAIVIDKSWVAFLLNNATESVTKMLKNTAVTLLSIPLKPFSYFLAALKPIRNSPTTINDRNYSGHALDRMQDRGIFPSVVENTIQNGVRIEGKNGRTNLYYDANNNISVIVRKDNERVVTTSFGFIGQ